MYRSFTIKNFRCFDELTVEGMGRINLIAGKNNVGKTALLEALWVHSGAPNPNPSHRLDILRGLEPDTPNDFLGNLFHGFDQTLVIELSALGDWGEDPREFHISFDNTPDSQITIETFNANLAAKEQNPANPFQSSKIIKTEYSFEDAGGVITKGRISKKSVSPGLLDTVVEWLIEEGTPPRETAPSCLLIAGNNGMNVADVSRYSQLEVDGRHGEVLGILKEIEPSLNSLAVAATGREPGIYANMGMQRLVPLQLLGGGMSRILSLALAIAIAPGGMVLVDEIENGIHYTVMEKVWKAIGAFARNYDVQLFATTHSRECVYYAHRAFEADEEEEMRFFRIDRARGKLRTVMYDKEMREAAFEMGVGIR